MLNNGKIKFLEDMVKSLAISVEDLTNKVELMQKQLKEQEKRD